MKALPGSTEFAFAEQNTKSGAAETAVGLNWAPTLTLIYLYRFPLDTSELSLLNDSLLAEARAGGS